MAKRIPPDQLREIVAKDRPGYRIVEPIPTPDTAMSDRRVHRNASNLDRLRQKFLGLPATESTASGRDSRQASDDTEIVQIAPETDTGRSKRKAAIVSGRTKKIVGEQG